MLFNITCPETNVAVNDSFYYYRYVFPRACVRITPCVAVFATFQFPLSYDSVLFLSLFILPTERNGTNGRPLILVRLTSVDGVLTETGYALLNRYRIGRTELVQLSNEHILRELESILYELHTIRSKSVPRNNIVWQYRDGVGGHFSRHLIGRVDRHNVLRPRRAQLLGLDILRAADSGGYCAVHRTDVFIDEAINQYPFTIFIWNALRPGPHMHRSVHFSWSTSVWSLSPPSSPKRKSVKWNGCDRNGPAIRQHQP